MSAQPNQLVTTDRTYVFGTIPPTQAIRVELAVVKVIGEALFKMAMQKNRSKADDDAAIAAALGLLAAKADPDEMLATMATVFKHVSIGGAATSVDLDAHMQGRNREVWTVFIAALRFNFADFMPAGPSVSVLSAGAPALS
jgi:hypothetical protein